MSSPALVVSLHDVSPLTYDRCTRIIAELSALGAKRTSLLVIPNHHSRGHFLDAPELCAWLRERAAEGHEIVTHGYFHRRERRKKEGFVQRMTTQVYTADEGEFYDIDREHAAELVRRANEELQKVGLNPCGFIAPAWLLSQAGEDALRELGCEYTTRLRTVSDLFQNTIYQSQSLCWSVRAAWRRVVSRLWNATLAKRLASIPLLRISIHPVDIEHEMIWRQIRDLVNEAARNRSATTYLDWVRQQRAASHFVPTHA